MDERVVRTDDGVDLHVARTGSGPDVVVLSGGPGCVHYLEREELAPVGYRAWYPEPRGVGRSGGGPHDLQRAVADLEQVRTAVGAARWLVLGHSWGSDLAIRYALDHPESVAGVVGVAGHGLHKDRTWSQAYEEGKRRVASPDIAYEPAVWQALGESFIEWIHQPDLYRRLAETQVPMTFLAAGDDIRPSWPLRQLARLVPGGDFRVVDGVPHDFWSTHPVLWRTEVTAACRGVGS